MTTQNAWISAYRAYDDDTLTALANPGLVRRAAKDVEAGKVSWLEQTDTAGIIEADGQRVALDARGPQQARCDCPAPGICKHILGATLWLRQQASESHHDETVQQVPVMGLDPLADLLALDLLSLFKTLSKAALRRAAVWLMDSAEVQTSVQGGSLLIYLPALNRHCRYVAGAGFDGMVSELSENERKAVHLAAVIAVCQTHEKSVVWPPGVEADIAVKQAVESAEPRLNDSEREFLHQTRRILYELLSNGLAHVSDVSAGHLMALAMSARSEGLPRLAAMLRNLSKTVDLLAAHDHRADQTQTLAMTARIDALCSALEQALGETLLNLRGQVRRTFNEADDHAEIKLLSLGAHWWETRSGARGLTLTFWEWEKQQFLFANLARPDGNDTTFTRRGAWERHSLWQGAGAPRTLSQGAWRVSRPRMAQDGRLGISGETRAEAESNWAADDWRLTAIGYDNWNVLAENLRQSVGLTAERVDCVVLRPSASEPVWLDEIQQVVHWVIFDRNKRPLNLRVACESRLQQRISNLEKFTQHGKNILAIVARVDRSVRPVAFEPQVLLMEHEGLLQTISLDFVPMETRRKNQSSPVGRILQWMESRQKVEKQASLPRDVSLSARLLGPILDVIETQCAMGRHRLSEYHQEQLQELHHSIQGVGLDVIAKMLMSYIKDSSPQQAMRLYYVCHHAMEIDALLLR